MGEWKMMGTEYGAWEDWFYRRCVGWDFKFALFPHRCYRSKRWIWLQRAYKGYAFLTGPGEAIGQVRWHSKEEHLIWLITK